MPESITEAEADAIQKGDDPDDPRMKVDINDLVAEMEKIHPGIYDHAVSRVRARMLQAELDTTRKALTQAMERPPATRRTNSGAKKSAAKKK